MKKLLIFLSILAIFGMAAYAESGETGGVGYWKNHHTEREANMEGAVAESTVFNTDTALRYYLSFKGRKTMEEQAKRQLAALLLNIASGLDVLTWLSQGELEIIQLHDAGYGAGTLIGNALEEIENAIHCWPEPDLPADCTAATTFEELESAKDLADEINNRE